MTVSTAVPRFDAPHKMVVGDLYSFNDNKDIIVMVTDPVGDQAGTFCGVCISGEAYLFSTYSNGWIKDQFGHFTGIVSLDGSL